jgi:hypothetical protein
MKGVFRLGSELELQALQKRMGTGRAHTMEGSKPACAGKRKYGNKRVLSEWGWFDSEAELTRWKELLLLEKAGQIQDLKRQVIFTLAPKYKFGKRWRPPLRFKADFVYIEAGKEVVEDKKGEPTRAYKIKRHLMATVHGITIRET